MLYLELHHFDVLDLALQAALLRTQNLRLLALENGQLLPGQP